MEDAGAAIAEERLDDDVAVFAPEGGDLARIRRDQRRRHEVLEMRDVELFRRVADMGGIVDHQRARMDMLQQMGGGDVRHVERRILAHQHDVHGRQIDRLDRSQRGMVAVHPAHRQRPRARGQPPVAEGQVRHEIVPERMAARLRRLGEGEGRVGIDGDAFDRIHLDGDGELHDGGVRKSGRGRCGDATLS